MRPGLRNVAMRRVMFDLALRVSAVRQFDVADLELDPTAARRLIRQTRA